MSPNSQGANMPAPIQVGLPPVVGMVGIGLLLRNIPGGILRVSSDAAWCAPSLHWCTMPDCISVCCSLCLVGDMPW